MTVMFANECNEPEQRHGMCRSIRGVLTEHPKTVTKRLSCILWRCV